MDVSDLLSDSALSRTAMSFCCCARGMYEHSKGDVFLLISSLGFDIRVEISFFSPPINRHCVLAVFILLCSIGTIVIRGLHKDLENISVHSSEVTLFWVLDAVISCVIEVLVAVLSFVILPYCVLNHPTLLVQLYPILSIPSCPIRFHHFTQESYFVHPLHYFHQWRGQLCARKCCPEFQALGLNVHRKKMQGFQGWAFASGCYMLFLQVILCVVALIVVVLSDSNPLIPKSCTASVCSY